MLVVDITPPGYWGQFERGPVPDWAPAKLATLQQSKIGPYTIAGFYDVSGNAPGGQGIAPHWFSWRQCPEGRSAAASELNGMAMRHPIAYASPINCDRFSLAGVDTPEGYDVGYDAARRWDPHCMEYLKFRKQDGQHFHRAYRAALALRDIDEFARDFAMMCLEHVRCAWGPRSIPPTGNTCYWGVDQWLESSYIKEGQGREFAHVARLVWTMEPDGEFADKLEQMVLRAGIPVFMRNGHYCPWSRDYNGGPWSADVGVAMTRELMLLGEAMSLRPGLATTRRQMLEWHGTRPAGAMNERGESYGTPNADYELFYGDFQMYDGTPERMIQVSSSRHPEGGCMPLNCCPERFWT